MYWKNQLDNRGQQYAGVILSTYRLGALAVAAAQMLILLVDRFSLVPSLILLIALGIYSIFELAYPIRWYYEEKKSLLLLGADIAVGLFLVVTTAGLYSPFILYTLTPVLTSALFLDVRMTSVVAGISAAYVIGSHVFNPFFRTEVGVTEIGYLFIYVTAVSLTAALPYLTNIRFRQRLRSHDVLEERQMLSRELHDVNLQTLSAICWQTQLLRRRLSRLGIELEEAAELENLAEKARQDCRRSLETLRGEAPDTVALSKIRESLANVCRDGAVDFHLDISDDLKPDPAVEFELTRVCQEAVANIKKHSGAKNAWITVKTEGGRIEAVITDDGAGFDREKTDRNAANGGGHGLTVMQERTEMVGGQFWVISRPGKGTEVHVEVPAVSGHSGL